MGCADVRDIVDHPCLDEGTEECADEGGRDLDTEHGTGRDLHVVAKLEIAGETDGLNASDESDSLEDHVCDGSTREDVSDDKLVHNLRRDLLIGDGLEHCQGKSE